MAFKDVLLKIVTLLHIIFIIFVILTPFTFSNYFLFLYTIFIPFLIMHWICNDNTCVLTIIERRLRKEIYGTVDEEDCLTCRLIEPVYDFRKNYAGYTIIIYTITIGLWLYAATKLYCKYGSGEIRSINELFRI